ncbi:MAG: IclR family transcriptional regulator [Sphingomonadales bacterium]|nr:IclR family transcriptional regulator [Sphingomonadales bacterium]MBU3992522.1 IclR family transcriptional regulator [Alphaproteobacteria bacterium]
MPRNVQSQSDMRISDRLNVGAGTVKSAGRVVEIFEFFDDRQAPATVMEIAEGLGYPQSSTSALLKSLVHYGYLDFDPHKRSYILSNRAALMGSWVNDQFFADGTILAMMRELGQQTGDTVLLATRNGTHAQYIHVLQATNPVRFHIVVGTARPLIASGTGYVLLSQLPDDEVRKIMTRTNAEARPGQPIVQRRDLMEKLELVRRRGYAFTCDMVTRGGGIIAAPIPVAEGSPSLVLAIAGISAEMQSREQELARTLLEAIDARFSRRQNDHTHTAGAIYA